MTDKPASQLTEGLLYSSINILTNTTEISAAYYVLTA